MTHHFSRLMFLGVRIPLTSYQQVAENVHALSGFSSYLAMPVTARLT